MQRKIASKMSEIKTRTGQEMQSFKGLVEGNPEFIFMDRIIKDRAKGFNLGNPKTPSKGRVVEKIDYIKDVEKELEVAKKLNDSFFDKVLDSIIC